MPASKTTFGRWSRNPEAEPVAALRQRLEDGLIRLEDRIKEVLNRAGGELSREEGENFFRLLGGYRGVSEAALAYARRPDSSIGPIGGRNDSHEQHSQ